MVKDLEITNKIKQLEVEKIYELELLQEELRFRTLEKQIFWKTKQI